MKLKENGECPDERKSVGNEDESVGEGEGVGVDVKWAGRCKKKGEAR